MTVRAKLLWAMTAIALLVAGPAVYGIGELAELRDIAAELRGRHAEAFLSLGRLRAALVELDRYQRSYLVVPTPDFRERVRRAIAEARLELRNLREAGYGAEADDVQRGLDTLEDAAHRLEAMVDAGQVEEATAYFETVKPVLAATTEALDPIAITVDSRSTAAVAHAQQISETATAATLLALIASLAGAIVLALWATGALVRPLRRLRAATAAVADGELVAPDDLPYARADEIGDLSRSFRTMTQRLAELDRLKAEFVSIASHELKTPINVIGGYSELLEDGVYGEISEDQKEVLGAIREQARNLAGLVQQLLDLSRLEAGNFPISMQEIPLRSFFEGLELAFRALAIRKRITFTVEIDPSVPPTIVGDPDRLRNEVLGNLLSNAFKFTPEGGRIRVRVSADDALRITVADTGVGIPGSKLPHIFEKYYQVGAQDRTRGSGLGLAIAREVVEAHGGRILAESTPGRGTTMHMELPLHPTAHPAGTAI